MFATRLRCVSMTPFARPVVPEEYGSTTTSSRSTGTCSASGAPPSEAIDAYPSASPMTYTSLTAESAIAAVAVSRNIGIVTRRVAPESTSWWCTSPDVYVGLTVVTTPPASATAWKMTPYSGQLGAITATTSPFASPLSNQPPA